MFLLSWRALSGCASPDGGSSDAASSDAAPSDAVETPCLVGTYELQLSNPTGDYEHTADYADRQFRFLVTYVPGDGFRFLRLTANGGTDGPYRDRAHDTVGCTLTMTYGEGAIPGESVDETFEVAVDANDQVTGTYRLDYWYDEWPSEDDEPPVSSYVAADVRGVVTR
jgi:hypothetical protein